MVPGSPTELLQSRRIEGGMPSRRVGLRVLAAALVVSQLSSGLVAASAPKPTEYEVKAAYLLNFGKFVRMSKPVPARSSFAICTVGHDPMDSALDSIASHSTIDGLPVAVAHVADISAAKSCDVVFLSTSERDRIREDLAILANADILTVSDAPDFLERGGMIQFVLVSNHVRFTVNLEAVERTHLVLSSELLRVAWSVLGKPPTGGLP